MILKEEKNLVLKKKYLADADAKNASFFCRAPSALLLVKNHKIKSVCKH